MRRTFGLALVAQARVATALEADTVAALLRSAAEERLTDVADYFTARTETSGKQPGSYRPLGAPGEG